MSQFIYGKNAAFSRITSKKDIKNIYLVEGFNDAKILDLIKNFNVKYVSKSKLESLCGNNYHQGIVIEVETFKTCSIEEVINEANKMKYPLIVMLAHIEDPHNMGAILRTCDAIGVNSIIVPSRDSAPLNSTVYKTSTGAIDFMKICEVSNLNKALDRLKKEGYWAVGAEASGNTDFLDVDYKDKIVLIIGSEGKGIPDLLYKNCDFKVSLPLVGHVNSLNASNACAILLYAIYCNRR